MRKFLYIFTAIILTFASICYSQPHLVIDMAEDIGLDTSLFGGNLSGTQDTVQKFADLFDDYTPTDSNAIHDNVSGEISAITNKAIPVGTDILIIEDSAASNAKKYMTIAAMEAALEAVLDLSDLQGAVTDSQVPNNITIDNATTAANLGADGVDALTEIAQGIKTAANDTSKLVVGTVGATDILAKWDSVGALVSAGVKFGTVTDGKLCQYTSATTTIACDQDPGAASAGGSNTQVQWNNSGSLGGISGATTDGTTMTLVTPIITLQDGNGAAPTTDGQIKFDRTTERLQVGDGSSTNEFYPGAHTTNTDAATKCSGATTYLSGEDSCNDLSLVYQPLSSNLTTYAGIAPSANVQSILGAADYAAIQALLSIDDLITLSGVSGGAANLGTFTGSTISDNGTIKAGMQELETAVETKAPVDSPTFTTAASAPTPSAGDNDTSIATTAYVQGEITGWISGQTHRWLFDIFDGNGLGITTSSIVPIGYAPCALTVTNVKVTTSSASFEIAGDVKYADARIGLANATVINTFDTTSGVLDDSTITSGSVASGKFVYLSFDSAPNASDTDDHIAITWDCD